MDQNIIILVLILIAILVAFYATYLSMDNSRKIRRLQNDIRDALGNINSTLKQEPNLSELADKPIPKVESRTNLQDLDQFPSLEEIENYDNQKMMAPIDADLKKELDAILDDNNNEEVVGGGGGGGGEGEVVEEAGVVENLETENQEDTLQSQAHQVDTDEPVLVEAEENVEAVSANLASSTSVEDEVEELVNPENEVNSSELNMESVSLEEPSLESVEPSTVVETELIPDIEPISLSDANLLKEIEALCPENRLQNKSDDTESVVESVIGEDEKKKRMDSLPPLENLTEEILQKMHDKNVKLICKRESIKVRGTKVERIQRILEAKEYTINVN